MKKISIIFFIIFALGVIILSLQGCEKKIIYEKIAIAEGHVKDSVSLSPIFGAKIFADTTLMAETDSIGYYKFAEFPGKMVLTAKAEGYQSQTKSVYLIANKRVRLDFLLTKNKGSVKKE